MALSDRNIVITPNRGKSEDPKIVIEAVKDQQKMIDDLRSRIAALESAKN